MMLRDKVTNQEDIDFFLSKICNLNSKDEYIYSSFKQMRV